jgi:hypothetical protein
MIRVARERRVAANHRHDGRARVQVAHMTDAIACSLTPDLANWTALCLIAGLGSPANSAVVRSTVDSTVLLAATACWEQEACGQH